MGAWTQTKAPTCTEKGSERRDCSRCDHFEERDVEANGHSYKAVATQPTCTEQGYTTYTCSACGDSYVDTRVDAKGHSYQDGICTTCGVAYWDNDGDGVLKILVIGNSHSANYTAFMSNVIEDMKADGFGTKIVIDTATIGSIGLYSGRNSNANATYRSHLDALNNQAGAYNKLKSKKYDLIIVQDYMESVVDDPAVFADGLSAFVQAVKQIASENGQGEPQVAWFADWVDVRSCGGDTALRDKDGNKISLPVLTREEVYKKSLANIAEIESRIDAGQKYMPDFVIHASTIKQNAMSSYLGTTKLFENSKYCLLESDSTHMTAELGKYLMSVGVMAEIVRHYNSSLALGKHGVDVGATLTLENGPSASGAGSQYEGAVNEDVLEIIREAVKSAFGFVQSKYTVDPADVMLEDICNITWDLNNITDQATALSNINSQVAAIIDGKVDAYSVNMKQYDSENQFTVTVRVCHGYSVKEIDIDLHRCIYDAVVTPPTYTEQGYTTYTCTVCGDSYKDNFVDRLPYIPGDLDGNEKVDTNDAIYLLMYTFFPNDYPVNQPCDFDKTAESIQTMQYIC